LHTGLWIETSEPFPSELKGTGIRNESTVEYIDERCLAGTIFPDDCMALALCYFKGNLLQSGHTSKMFGNVIDF
jgi:hypothetical protein